MILYCCLTLLRAPVQVVPANDAAVAAVLSQIYVEESMKNTGHYLKMRYMKIIPVGFAGDYRKNTNNDIIDKCVFYLLE